MTDSCLTHARVLRLFDYDTPTGNLIWKVSESNRIKVGDAAGAVARNGRRYIGVDGERLMAHRLVWFHQKGAWPAENLAPANGDYLDTRIENLIEQTAQETASKGKMKSTNTSGVKGVWFDKTKQKWAAQTVRNYRTIFHGYFSTIDEAKVALANAVVDDYEYLSPEETRRRRDAKRGNANQRRMWNRMLRACNGAHGWGSIHEFAEDVGSSPKPNFYVAPADSSMLVGPANFVWSPPQYDHTVRDGRMAANRSYRDNDEMYRDRELRRDYGINGLAEYERMFKEQNGVCAVCSNPETEKIMDKVRPLSVDHSHANGKVRGLLCGSCNRGLGKFRDSPSLLRKAADYIEKWAAIHATEAVQS